MLLNTPVSGNLIFLIGYMGCGKTTWGKKLAAASGYEFLDLDDVFEQRAGQKIAEYFIAYGEGGFRKKESEILKNTIYPSQSIIATGGGLPCLFDNMQWMNTHGQTVYLKLPPGVLASRLENARVERPVLQGKKGQELLNFITKKLAEREEYYNRAAIIVDTLSIDIEKLKGLLNL